MKILHICSDYYDSLIYKKLINELNNQNIDNFVYVPKFNSKESKTNNVFTALRHYTIIDRIMFFRKEQIGYNDICTRISLKEIDVIHSHNLFSGGYIAYKLNQNFGIPYIVAVRNTDLNVFFRYMIHLRKLGVKILRSAQKIIFISPAYKSATIFKFVPKRLHQIICAKSVVVQNGIDNYFLDNINNKTDYIWDKKNIRLVCVSSLTANKNIKTSIKAAKSLQLKYNVKLTFVGKIENSKYEGVERKYNFVDYYPYSPKEKVIEILRNADIFVMPSKKETFGLVYAEAISQGLPVIYTKGQGFDGFFKDGIVGYSVKSSDYKEVADSIIKIYKNYSTFTANCTKGVQVFDWKTICQKYIEIYKKVVI